MEKIIQFPKLLLLLLTNRGLIVTLSLEFDAGGINSNGNVSVITSCQHPLIKEHSMRFGHSYCSHICGHLMDKNGNLLNSISSSQSQVKTFSDNEKSASCHKNGNCLCHRSKVNSDFDPILCPPTNLNTLAATTGEFYYALRCKFRCAFNCGVILNKWALCKESRLLGPERNILARICACDCPRGNKLVDKSIITLIFVKLKLMALFILCFILYFSGFLLIGGSTSLGGLLFKGLLLLGRFYDMRLNIDDVTN